MRFFLIFYCARNFWNQAKKFFLIFQHPKIFDWNKFHLLLHSFEVIGGMKLQSCQVSFFHCCPYGKCGTNQELFKTANSMTKRNNTSFFCLARHLPFEEIWGLKACGLLTDFTLQSLPKIIVLNHNVQNGIDFQHLLN